VRRSRLRARAGAWVLTGLLVASGVPALAQDATDEPGTSAAPEATELPTESEYGRPDLYLDMPYAMGGFEPEIVMTRGEAHFTNLDAEDQTRVDLEGFLDAVGAEVKDMVSGYALVAQDDFFSFVVAIRIEGATPGTLLPAYIPILYDDLVDPSGIAGRMSGKDVVIVASLGADEEYVELYVYDQGDTLWMLQGPTNTVENTLEDLPDPLRLDYLTADPAR